MNRLGKERLRKGGTEKDRKQIAKTHPFEKKTLVKKRLRKVLQKARSDSCFVTPLVGGPGKLYPDELIQEIEMETEIGKMWMEMEVRRIKQVVDYA